MTTGKKALWFWVCRDLSNGDGADGNTRPTYVWADKTRREARIRNWAHQRDRKLSRLSAPECWPAERLTRHYDACGAPGSVSENYYVRKIAHG